MNTNRVIKCIPTEYGQENRLHSLNTNKLIHVIPTIRIRTKRYNAYLLNTNKELRCIMILTKDKQSKTIRSIPIYLLNTNIQITTPLNTNTSYNTYPQIQHTKKEKIMGFHWFIIQTNKRNMVKQYIYTVYTYVDIGGGVVV